VLTPSEKSCIKITSPGQYLGHISGNQPGNWSRRQKPSLPIDFMECVTYEKATDENRAEELKKNRQKLKIIVCMDKKNYLAE
jgi:hypothetical protein